MGAGRPRPGGWPREWPGRDGNKLPPDRISEPPSKRGNAPTGDDGHPVELHHSGQQPDSPLDETTRTDHRGGDNFKKNKPGWCKLAARNGLLASAPREDDELER